MILFTLKQSRRSGQCTEPSTHVKGPFAHVWIHSYKMWFIQRADSNVHGPDSAKSFVCTVQLFFLNNRNPQRNHSFSKLLTSSLSQIHQPMRFSGLLFVSGTKTCNLLSFSSSAQPCHKSDTWLRVTGPSWAQIQGSSFNHAACPWLLSARRQ